MMLYLTGAQTSRVKSKENPQNDPSKSLGGYISSTVIPNGYLNELWDTISQLTLQKRLKETLGFGLINELDVPVKNVQLKIVTTKENIASFRVAAVGVSMEDYAMQQIKNRYQEPLYGEFHNADFERASVDIKILTPATQGEQIALYPFNIVIDVTENGIEGTWAAFENAFYNDETYCVSKVSENVFRIAYKDETVLEEPISCSYLSDGSFTAQFEGEMKNGKTNSVTLISDEDTFQPQEAIGIWLQRDINPTAYPSNERILENFKNKVEPKTVEDVEIIISYDLANEETETEQPNQNIEENADDNDGTNTPSGEDADSSTGDSEQYDAGTVEGIISV